MFSGSVFFVTSNKGIDILSTFLFVSIPPSVLKRVLYIESVNCDNLGESVLQN